MWSLGVPGCDDLGRHLDAADSAPAHLVASSARRFATAHRRRYAPAAAARRTTSTMRAGEPCHGVPCPGSTHAASRSAMRSRDARACAGSSVNGAGAGPGRSREHVAGREGIADEHGPRHRRVHRDAAGGVPGHADHARSAGQGQLGAVLHLDEVGQPRRAQRALADAVSEKAEHSAELHRPPRGLRLRAAAGAVGVGRVHVHGHPVSRRRRSAKPT